MDSQRTIILVHGGVASVITSSGPVDIVDIDNLQETTAEDFRRDSLSREAKDYLLLDWPDLAASLGIEA